MSLLILSGGLKNHDVISYRLYFRMLFCHWRPYGFLVKRAILLSLWFIFGLFLGAIPVLCYAESIAATSTTDTGTLYPWGVSPYGGGYSVGNSPEEAYQHAFPGTTITSCSPIGANVGCLVNGAWNGKPAIPLTTNSCVNSYFSQIQCGIKLSCESGKNWTLSGSNCIRPDCSSPSIRLSDGTCSKSCSSGVSADTFLQGNGDNLVDRYCSPDNCIQTITKVVGGASGYSCSFGSTGMGLCRAGVHATMVNTGGSCDFATNTYPQPPATVPTNDANPCPAGNGIASAANGFIRCLPPGSSTPGSSTTVQTPTTPGGTPSTTITPDPNQTVTNTVCDGTTCTKTTSTVDSNGVVTEKIDKSSQSVFCEANPNNSECKKASGSGTGTGSGTGNDLHFASPTAGKFGSKSADIQAAEDDITNELNLIKSQASSLIGKLSTGSGSMPCPEAIQVLGSSFQLCAAKFSNQLAPIQSAMLLIGALAALFIIFR